MSLANSDLPTSILFCRLCQSLYRKPRTLPCLHSFCLDCVSHLAPTSNEHGQMLLDCPLCGQSTILPSAGVTGLTSNDFLARMCHEYVGEVQRTLVTARSLSPAHHRLGPVSSASAGLAPDSHFQHSAGSGSLKGPTEGVFASAHRPMSPSRTASGESVFRGRQGFSAARPVVQPSVGSPSSSSYLHSNHLPTSPHHSPSSFSSTTTSDVVLQSVRRLSTDTLPSRGVGIHRRLSSTPKDVLRTWECLQRKVNSLQSACLQATYSLETLNMVESNWLLRKQDLRRDVQRRSAQLQFFIKRQERLLLAALDSRKTEESFTTVAEGAKRAVRANLKGLIHETDVVKSVLDLATDSEIMSLSSLLLNSTVCQTPVNLEAPELGLMVPDDQSLEDMVARNFGCLTSTLVTHPIFTPEEIEQTLPEEHEDDDAFSVDTSTVDVSSTTDMASITTSDNYEDMSFIDESDDEENEVTVEETLEMIDGRMQVVSKSSKPSKKQCDYESRPSSRTPINTERKDQDSRGRGTDIRRTVNSATTAHTSTAKDTNTAQMKEREAARTSSKQDRSADSSSLPSASRQQSTIDKFNSVRQTLREKRRELLLNAPLFPAHGTPTVAHLVRGEKRVQSLDRMATNRDQPRRSFSPAVPKENLVPSVTAPVITTPTSTGQDHTLSSYLMIHSDPGQDVTASQISTLITSPTSPTHRPSRPVRRAISAASDKASKMEYLRESWRKRKELLNQNETYFTAQDTILNDGESTKQIPSEDSANKQNKADSASPSQTSKTKVKHSLISRISNLRQALKKNGRGEEGVSECKTAEKAKESGSGKGTQGDKKVAGCRSSAESAAEQKVLRTIESILQKKNVSLTDPEPQAKPASCVESRLTETSLTSAISKPSMLVKPCPREQQSADPTSITQPLETLSEDEGRASGTTPQKPGLRVTSPARGEVNKDKLQQVRANIRQKKQRWRSLSLT